MSMPLGIFVYLILLLVSPVRAQLPPGSMTCLNCTTIAAVDTTTIKPYTDCASNEYYIQGQCRKYSHEVCSSLQHIGVAMTACNTSDSDMLRNLALLINEARCNYYHRTFTCIVGEIHASMPLCSATEVQFLQLRHLEELLEQLSVKLKFVLQLETCEVYSAAVTLKLRNSNWTSLYSNKSSQSFWAYRDLYDKEILLLSAGVFGDLYRDSAVTNIRQGSVLIDVTIFWSEATNQTAANITRMLQEGLNTSHTYGQMYEVHNVDLVNKGLTCTVHGVTYITGEMFRTRDLCNRCICSDGNLYCTSMTCSESWLGEYCSLDTDCADRNNTVCVDMTCQCKEHLYPVFVNTTRVCGKKGVNEACSISDDCDFTTDCNDGICLCLSSYFEVNNTCQLYPEKLVAEEESIPTLILIVVFSVVVVLVLGVIIVVFVKRRHTLRKHKSHIFTNLDESDEALPNPFMGRRSLFKDKISRHDMIGFSLDEERELRTPQTNIEDDNTTTADTIAMSTYRDNDEDNKYLWNLAERGGPLPTALHVNPYLTDNSFLRGRVAKPFMFGDFSPGSTGNHTPIDTQIDSLDDPDILVPETYNPEDISIKEDNKSQKEYGPRSNRGKLSSMSVFNGADRKSRKLWNIAEHETTVPTALHVNPYITGNNVLRGRLAKPFLFGDFSMGDNHLTHLPEAYITEDVGNDDDSESNTLGEPEVKQGKSSSLSALKHNHNKGQKIWNLTGRGSALPTTFRTNPYLTGHSFYNGRLSRPFMFGDLSNETSNNPLRLNKLDDPDAILAETYNEDDLTDDGRDEPSYMEFEGYGARMKTPRSMSVFKEDDAKRQRKIWNVTENEDILPTTLHVNPYLTGTSFYKGRLAKPYLFGSFTEGFSLNPITFNNLEDPDTQVPGTSVNGNLQADQGRFEFTGELKQKLRKRQTMSLFTDEDTDHLPRMSSNQHKSEEILPTTLHVNPHLGDTTFYKGKLAKPNLLGGFEDGDEFNPYLSFA